jgi:hypothetical protein
METIKPQTYIKRNPEMVTSNIDGEIVMMSIDQGEYYGLDEIGSRIWELLENPITLEQLINKLIEEFEVDEETCKSDTLDFLNQMLEKNIVFIQ